MEAATFTVIRYLLEIATLATSIYLIVAGVSSKEKYQDAKYIRKRIPIIGIILLILMFIEGIPTMISGFMKGWHEADKMFPQH